MFSIRIISNFTTLVILLFVINMSHIDHVVSFMTPSLSKALMKPKYLQGLFYGQGNLFFGTSTGRICCISRDDNAKLTNKWIQHISTRNIRKISGNDDLLVVTCDSENGLTTPTVVCDQETGDIIDHTSWTDTTVFETITDKYEWIRVNAVGDVMVKILNWEDDFKIKYRLPMSSMDFVSAVTLHKKKLYVVTMSGKVIVLNLDKYEISLWHNLHFDIPTCIHVVSHANSDAEFLYVGNRVGMVHFTQIVDNKMTSHTQKQLHTAVVTQIDSNYQGVFISFDDSKIVGIETMSFRELYSVNTNTSLYTNIDSFCLSPRGLIFVDSSKQKIRLEAIERRKN